MKTVNPIPTQPRQSLGLLSSSLTRLALILFNRSGCEIHTNLCPKPPKRRRLSIRLGLDLSPLFLATTCSLLPESLLAAPAYVQSAYFVPQTPQIAVSV